MDDNALDKVITGCIAAGLGSILVCSFVIPTVANMLGNLTQTNYPDIQKTDLDMWKALIGLVVVMAIIGLIIAIVRGFALRSR